MFLKLVLYPIQMFILIIILSKKSILNSLWLFYFPIFLLIKYLQTIFIFNNYNFSPNIPSQIQHEKMFAFTIFEVSNIEIIHEFKSAKSNGKPSSSLSTNITALNTNNEHFPANTLAIYLPFYHTPQVLILCYWVSFLVNATLLQIPNLSGYGSLYSLCLFFLTDSFQTFIFEYPPPFHFLHIQMFTNILHCVAHKHLKHTLNWMLDFFLTIIYI